MKPKYLKELLLSEVKSFTERFDEFCVESGKHFTRKRKLPFEAVIKTVIGMESKSLANELINAFDTEPTLPSASALIQQRSKIKPEAFKAIFHGFSSKIAESPTNLRILAVDGSDVQIATNLNDLSSFHPGTNGQKPYNLLHLNALYDLNQHIL